MRPAAGHGGPMYRTRWIIGGLTALSIVLAACGGGGGSPQAGSNAGTPDPNGVLRFGVDLNNGFSNDFDPGTGLNDCSFQELSQIYSSITYEPPGTQGNAKIAPGIAQSWQIQGTTLTLHLRPGVKFSDGEPVDANAVMQSIEHVRKSPLRTSLLAIDTMDPVNATTLVITLKQPPTPGDLLLAFSFIDGMVMAPSSFASAATTPIGSGPFVLKSYQPGSEIQMVANKNYFDKSAYKLGGVDFVQLTAGPQAIGALIDGAVDMIELMPEDYPTAKTNSNIGIAITPSYQYMLMQLRENSPPFNIPGVRAALEYAINREVINKAVFNGLGQPAYQPFPSSSPGYNKTVGNNLHLPAGHGQGHAGPGRVPARGELQPGLPGRRSRIPERRHHHEGGAGSGRVQRVADPDPRGRHPHRRLREQRGQRRSHPELLERARPGQQFRERVREHRIRGPGPRIG